MSIPPPRHLPKEPNLDDLSAHLEHHYCVAVGKITRLDHAVYHVQLASPAVEDWVIRTLPLSTYPLPHLRSTARLLDHLHRRHAYPAERLATDSVETATSSFLDFSVLATKFVPGAAPRGDKRTFARLGRLLGKLHALPFGTEGEEHNSEPDSIPSFLAQAGGAWHHLCPPGSTFQDERLAALDILSSVRKESADGDAQALVRLEMLSNELDAFSDLAALPHALVHADFVPVNTIEEASASSADGKLRIVDWLGAGVGARVASLGSLLWAAGNRHLGLVNVVMTTYGAEIRLDDEELRCLETAIGQRAVTIKAWEVGMGRSESEDVAEWLEEWRKTVALIAERTREMARR